MMRRIKCYEQNIEDLPSSMAHLGLVVADGMAQGRPLRIHQANSTERLG